MAYQRVNWVNEEVGKTTPINAENLNKMDSAIGDLDTKVTQQEAAIHGKADKTDVDAKVFVAEYNVTTAQEIIAHIDSAKEPFAPMLIKRGNDYYTVITAQKQSDDKVIIRSFATLSGNYYVFMYTVTNGTWASSSYGFQQLLVSGTNIKTVNGESVLGRGDIIIDSYDDTALVNRVQATETALAGKADASSIPSKTSDLTNDSDYQTGADVTTAISGKADKTELPENVSDLPNDAGYVTSSYVDQKVQGEVSGLAHITSVVLGAGDDLPATGSANTWYLKPSGTTYEIWAYYGGGWVSLGLANAVDLTGYLKQSDYIVDNALSMTSNHPVENQAVTDAIRKIGNAEETTYAFGWDMDKKAITIRDTTTDITQSLILTGVAMLSDLS